MSTSYIVKTLDAGKEKTLKTSATYKKARAYAHNYTMITADTTFIYHGVNFIEAFHFKPGMRSK